MWSIPGESETKHSGDLLTKEIHPGIEEEQEKDYSGLGRGVVVEGLSRIPSEVM